MAQNQLYQHNATQTQYTACFNTCNTAHDQKVEASSCGSGLTLVNVRQRWSWVTDRCVRGFTASAITSGEVMTPKRQLQNISLLCWRRVWAGMFSTEGLPYVRAFCNPVLCSVMMSQRDIISWAMLLSQAISITVMLSSLRRYTQTCRADRLKHTSTPRTNTRTHTQIRQQNFFVFVQAFCDPRK